MKTINSIKQLKAEKKRLAEQLQVQEEQMRQNWGDLKDALRPANMAMDTVSSIMNRKAASTENKDNLLKSVLSYGAWLLTRKIMDKTGKRMSRFYRGEKKS
ncbi:MAG: hypothetical protein JNM68_14535 [Dinghuibacter sp.]|nr:hypothetical protein [Dinghuibacter sp.]